MTKRLRMVVIFLLATGWGSYARAAKPAGASGVNLLPAQAEPSNAGGWFQRADDITNIRLPGAAPFHLKATFRAGPGLDFAKPGKSTIVAGDGTYDETWVSPEQWRREITLGSYHAVEVRAGGVRKLQASSDYEPTRVLMFLDALYNPVPRNLISPELIDRHAGWKIEHLAAGGLQHVRISSSTEVGANGLRHELKHEYDFLANGVLIRNEESDYISTTWQDFVAFGGKVVPRHVMAGGMGNTLIDGRVAIEPLASTPPADVFTLPGDPVTPGETLRPLHQYDVHYGEMLGTPAFGVFGEPFQGTVSGVVDRSGVPREMEVIAAQDTSQADMYLKRFSEFRYAPSTIDGSPCEVVMRIFTLGAAH